MQVLLQMLKLVISAQQVVGSSSTNARMNEMKSSSIGGPRGTYRTCGRGVDGARAGRGVPEVQRDPGAVVGVARVGVEVLEGQLHARPADVPQPCRPVQDHPHVHPPPRSGGTGSWARRLPLALLRTDDEAEEEDGEKTTTKRECRYGTAFMGTPKGGINRFFCSVG